MKKVLIIGNGAREHVIAETLLRSSHQTSVITYGSATNPGLLQLSTAYEVGSLSDFDNLKDFANHTKPDFAIMGPEAPIAAGMADMLLATGIKSASPLKVSGALESSKSFARDLLQKYNIPGNPAFKVFYKSEGIREFMEKLGGNYVVKSDGLKGGKGVKVSGDHLETISDGVSYAEECLREDGKVVV